VKCPNGKPEDYGVKAIFFKAPSNFEQPLLFVSRQNILMKRKDLNLKQSISVPCPVCKAAAGKKCQLSAGGFRFESHVDRKLAAIEVIAERKSGGPVSAYPFDPLLARYLSR